ncbi:MAG: hypothetical protein J6M93_06540 [Succinivibrio sp.]|nr:hypothetical protein [Succinivibrio sp.]
MNPESVAAAAPVMQLPADGMFSVALAHPLLSILVLVLILIAILFAIRLLIKINQMRKNKNEVNSLKKDLMVWSVLSSLVHGGKKTDRAKVELNSKLHTIDNIFKHAINVIMAQRRYLSSKRPWFLVVGEPSCGKSTLLDMSELDFKAIEKDDAVQKPPLNFYINRDAIVLDITGKIFFDNWLGGSSAEWAHICSQIRKRHKTKPLDGIVLTISAEALLADDYKLTQKKTSLIVGELFRLTGTLKMYLPCYVVITKMDTIMGFREYFQNLDDESRGQMVGYQPRNIEDESFNEEDFDNFFDRLLSRIRNGVLGLMCSKSVLDLSYADKSRIELTGDMFLFADNFAKVRTNLKAYLNTLFGNSRFRGKHFTKFKGVYFTSANDKGFCLNDRFAALQGKSIDDAPLYDNNFKESRGYFIKNTLQRIAFVADGSAGFTRHEEIRRRMPYYLGCAALGAISVIYLYGALFVGPEFKRQLGDDTMYFQGLSRQFDQGVIDASRLLSVDGKGNGVTLFDNPMPNDTKVPRMNFFSETQRRLQKEIKVPWQFFPGYVFEYGLSGNVAVADRYFLYNQLQTKMTFMPLVESLEYNFMMQGNEPFSDEKRDALFQLMDIAQFAASNKVADYNDVYDGSMMQAFMNYMYPQTGTNTKQRLELFFPEFDVLARFNNNSIVLNQNYVESCNTAINGFIENWKLFRNYSKHDYVELVADADSAHRLIDIYSSLEKGHAMNFKEVSQDQIPRYLQQMRILIDAYQSESRNVEDFARFAAESVAKSKNPAQDAKGGADGGDKKDDKASEKIEDNPYFVSFENAYNDYVKKLHRDFRHFREFDTFRSAHTTNHTGMYFGGINFRAFPAIEAEITKKLSEEHDRIIQNMTKMPKHPLFLEYGTADKNVKEFNFNLLSRLLDIAVMEPPSFILFQPGDIGMAVDEVEDHFEEHQSELKAFVDMYGGNDVLKPWTAFVDRVLRLQRAVGRIKLGHSLLALYPNESSDLNMLSELTILVGESGNDLGSISGDFSFEISKEVLGDYELRQEYNPEGFFKYINPIAQLVKLRDSKDEELAVFRDELKKNKLLSRPIKVFGKYAGSYINYWGHIGDSMHPSVGTYGEFYELASSSKAYQINAQLQELYTLSYDAIKVVDDCMLDDNTKTLKANTLKLLEAKIKTLDIAFTDQCNDVLTAWTLLGPDATYANRTVTQMTDKELKTSLLSLGKSKKGASAIPWWGEFTALGSKLLKRDASSEASMSLAMFQSQLKFFPLVKDGDAHVHVLDRNEIKKLMLMFKSFGLSEMAEDPKENPLPGMGLDDDKELGVDADLKAPLVFSSNSSKQGMFRVWATSMEKLLSLLSRDDKSMNFRISRVNAADQNRLKIEQGYAGYELAIARYRYFTVTVGNGKASEKVAAFSSDEKQPGIAQGSLNNQTITFNFYKFSDSEDPDCVLTLDGAYPSLQLYLNEQGEYSDESKVTYVPLLLMGNDGASSLFYIGISFTGKLPLAEDWPSIADWPDMSLFDSVSMVK